MSAVPATPVHAGSRLRRAFADAGAQGRCALVPFIVAGDPDLATTARIAEALVDAGADVLELGVPYSDPLADGPAIVAAGQRALDAGATLDGVLDLIAAIPIPVVLFTYANPILQYGIERLTARLRTAGAAGVIIPDLPLEETLPLSSTLQAAGIDVPLLIAPTTRSERAKRIAAASSGFLYLVSRLGVTGAGDAQRPDPRAIETNIARIREFTDLPVAVGFGLAQRAQLEAIAPFADGAIVGSALVDHLHAHRTGNIETAARSFLAELQAGCAKPRF